ncbi:hypothetical protein [Amycolatopsis sp. NPDC051128]|uniref:hypothetical protein n=1 Tax=Amycolatopsis sp. NPDC051128 TaxID=3155412 RepID=UPI003443EF21
MGDFASLLPSAGPSTVFLIVLIVLLRLWVKAERRADALATQLHTERTRLDEETAKRRAAEEKLAQLRRRKGGDVDA